MSLRALLLCIALLLLTGTSSCFLANRAMVGVERVRPEKLDQQLNRNALDGDEPSASTLELLHTLGLGETYEEDPEATLVGLHRAVCADPARRGLHALAELAFLQGKRLKSPDHYLAAAVYAYMFLLGEDGLTPASPYDRRFRWACDMYNRGLRGAFTSTEGGEFTPQVGRRTLPVGSLEVSLNLGPMPFDVQGARYYSADDYEVWGLSLRQRDSGLGAPLITKLAPRANDPEGMHKWHVAQHVPSTAFLRVQGSLSEMESGLSASLELHSGLDTPSVAVKGQAVPLEADLSATLAFALNTSRVWNFSTLGFFKSDASVESKLYLARPYQRGRVPVVFVHGTASNPGNWAEMINLLSADRRIRESTQVWLFQYSTGGPIMLSAAHLREQLCAVVNDLDPSGTDEALRHMVIVGHSQGGLLTKLMVVDGEMSWVERVTHMTLDNLNLSEEQVRLLHACFDFKRLPFVDRVIFMATPHRGSYLADRPFSRLLGRMIDLPGEVTGLAKNLFTQQERLPPEFRGRSFNSLDNMMSTNPMLSLLAEQPLAPGVKAHSIIPIRDADPLHPEKARDGVVAYSSEHIAGVESELLVASGHSCQGNPMAIREVRRILLEHLNGLTMFQTQRN